MPLHHKTKEAALKKHGHLEGDALLKALQTDTTNYGEEEIAEIMSAADKARTAPGTASPAPVAVATAPKLQPASSLLGPISDPNREIRGRLQSFDYTKLTGETFKNYCLLVQSLGREDKYDFELYQVEVVRRERYRGVKDSPMDTVGFKIRNTTPMNRTRIPVKHALTMNGIVIPFKDANGDPEPMGFETVGCQLDHNGIHGRYYLLKK